MGSGFALSCPWLAGPRPWDGAGAGLCWTLAHLAMVRVLRAEHLARQQGWPGALPCCPSWLRSWQALQELHSVTRGSWTGTPPTLSPGLWSPGTCLLGCTAQMPGLQGPSLVFLRQGAWLLGQTEGEAADLEPHRVVVPSVHGVLAPDPRFGFVNRALGCLSLVGDPTLTVQGQPQFGPGHWKWSPSGRSEGPVSSLPCSRYSAWQLGGLAWGLRCREGEEGQGGGGGPREAAP